MASLNPCDKRTSGVKDIYTTGQPGSDYKVAISSNPQAVRGAFQSLENDPFVCQVVAAIARVNVKGIDITLSGTCEVDLDGVVVEVAWPAPGGVSN